MNDHLTLTELDDQSLELLPERETLFFNWGGTNVVATNVALATNGGGFGNAVGAIAIQGVFAA